MVAVSIDDSPRRVLDVVIAEGYSKLPVYQESKDDIVGVMHDRELLIALANGSLAHANVRALMRPAVHVPETKKIAELLREMQRDKFSLAIVVDEYGGTAGLVTMEDLLEEIVGEIRDEHDVDEQEPIAVVSEREAVVEAGTNIEDVNAKLGIELPTEDFETIGGYTVGPLRAPSERRRRDRRRRITRACASIARAAGAFSRCASTPTAPSEPTRRNRRTLTQPRAYKTRGVVLRGRQLGEADRIMTLFTHRTRQARCGRQGRSPRRAATSPDASSSPTSASS